MDKQFVERFMNSKPQLREWLAQGHPDNYKNLVRKVIEIISNNEYGEPDPNNIHEIDDGAYQGVLIYIIPEKDDIPFSYWYVRIFYGSCSASDTLDSIRAENDHPNEQNIDDYMTLMLHIVQQIKKMDNESIV